MRILTAGSGARLAIAEGQTSAGAWLDYVWLNGRLVTVLTSTGGLYPTDTDQTGRPVVMTNWFNQAVAWQAQGLPFTSNVSTTTWFNFNIGFPGQYYDSESGLWHNGNRDYDADLGRYIESDPIGLAGGINAYAYVEDNPVTNFDELGLCKTCEGNAVYSAVGPKQATGTGALGITPPIGSVAISPAAFGLPYNTVAQRVAAQSILKSAMHGITIQTIGLDLDQYESPPGSAGEAVEV